MDDIERTYNCRLIVGLLRQELERLYPNRTPEDREEVETLKEKLLSVFQKWDAGN